ncbi:MAG: aminotransferase class V-fold PLP-dependent enzyme [Pseudomonadota bacterium]
MGATNHRDHWTLDPDIAFLNHGSFGACPRPVLAEQQAWRDRLERQPVQFFARDLAGLLDEARAPLAQFLGCAPADLAWVTNATAGVNAVLQSQPLAPGDELLTTDHEYNACRNVLDYVAARTGARVVVATLPLPIEEPAHVVDTLVRAVTANTRLLLVDHVTSQTGLVLPIAAIAKAMRERGIRVLVDGAHAPGMVPVALDTLPVDYYTGNCHKWLCAPKGAGFLWVAAQHQEEVRPAIISHGANAPTGERSRFRNEFDWNGTSDPTAMLCVPAALRFMGELLPGGWPALREQNRALALTARELLIDALGGAPLAPPEMIGSMVAHPLPPSRDASPPTSMLYANPLQESLLREHRIEVPIVPWPAPPARLVRISAQLYNELDEYQRLVAALPDALARDLA